jgi:hypothetical protein
MAIAAAHIQRQDYYGRADWALGVLAREDVCPIETYPVPRHVESAVNVVWKGRTLMTPIGGGVNIQPLQALTTDRLLADEDGQLKDTHEAIDIKGLAKDRWWWD